MEHLISGPVMPMIWEGDNVIKLSRQMIGKPEPLDATPGTIRGDLGTARERTVVHGSHSIEEASREIPLWFNTDELVEWELSNYNWIFPLV